MRFEKRILSGGVPLWQAGVHGSDRAKRALRYMGEQVGTPSTVGDYALACAAFFKRVVFLRRLKSHLLLGYFENRSRTHRQPKNEATVTPRKIAFGAFILDQISFSKETHWYASVSWPISLGYFPCRGGLPSKIFAFSNLLAGKEIVFVVCF
jgi:hypothetical protein